MRTLRIALVTERFYPETDETTRLVKHVADELVAAGHALLLVAAAPGLPTYRGAPVARIRFGQPGRQVRAALAEFEPDLVHVVTPGTIGLKALKHARRLGIPTVVTDTSTVPEFAPASWRATVADRADRLLVTSRWIADRLAAEGVPARLWSPGVAAAEFTPAARDEQLHAAWAGAVGRDPGIVVGYVGGLRKSYGVRLLAQVAQVPGTRLVVVGDGPQRGWLTSRLPSVRLTGALGTPYLATAVASLDVLVHPRTRATCSQALREGAACGVPLVAPRAGGAVDVVRHLETGLLYDPADPVGLADAVAALVADRRRAQLGARGRELALGRTWAHAVAELLDRHYPAALGTTALAA